MLNDKIALVTGATRGIGRAIALELGRQGATVIGTATSDDGAGKHVRRELDTNAHVVEIVRLLERLKVSPREVPVVVIDPTSSRSTVWRSIRSGTSAQTGSTRRSTPTRSTTGMWPT